MPEPPSVNLLTRSLLENPLPVAVALLVIAVVVGWLGFRDGRVDRIRAAVVPFLLGIGVLAVGQLVVTPAERGRAVVRELVDAVVEEDLAASLALFSGGALYHQGSTRNPGRDLDTIRGGLSMVAQRYDIESNRITRLRGYTLTEDAATVHLATWTDAGGYGPSPSQWVIDVARQDDGTWKVTDLTMISVNGRPPPAW